MAENWGTKTAEVDWVPVPGEGDPAPDLDLTDSVVGYHVHQRAHLLTVSGLNTENIVTVKASIGEGNFITVATLTGATSYVVRDFDDVNRVQPRQIRLSYAANEGEDPANIKVRLASKWLPTTLRKE